jgi:protein gp37
MAKDCPETAIDWVIVGGESGPRARPMHPDWVRSIRDQCVAAGVPFFFKQWGEFIPCRGEEDPDFWITYDGRRFAFHTRKPTIQEKRAFFDHKVAFMKHVGKKAAGRLLDGRTWDEYPNIT